LLFSKAHYFRDNNNTEAHIGRSGATISLSIRKGPKRKGLEIFWTIRKGNVLQFVEGRGTEGEGRGEGQK